MSKPNYIIHVTFTISGTEDTVSDDLDKELKRIGLSNYCIESVEKE